jgi:hypothetical protein
MEPSRTGDALAGRRLASVSEPFRLAGLLAEPPLALLAGSFGLPEGLP